MQKESAQELLRSHLPAEFVAYLKPETLEQADTSFIDANLKRRFIDRLFKVELTDDIARELGTESPHVHVLVLVDHKSPPDKYTVAYYVRAAKIWKRPWFARAA
ncbi:Rpn family recombination-promoting nuclease/putative transposase [Pirellulaceae bacterium SH449]